MSHTMKNRSALEIYKEGGAWWETKISDIQKNSIELRGYPIEELIGELSYPQMLYLLLVGELLDDSKASLFESVLVAGADHGPRAPSIAAARMAVTCGISFNSSVATGMNLLGDIHGGAGEKAMCMLYDAKSIYDENKDVKYAAKQVCQDWLARKAKIPGIGHQLHDDDPRVRRLYELSQSYVEHGHISGIYLRLAEAIRHELENRKGKKITMNIDGVSAAIQCELNIPAEAAKGIFSLSRGMGIVAHAYEELTKGALVKGPCPNEDKLVRYVGHGTRHLREGETI
ncbi:citryl-CoA lyase [Bacillus pumilus]|uniref:citrate synthase (unknown stereospecificity) n=1 Tax=Bacillus pumilus TaxID=1408 RepID=A0AAD0ML64_BACPU|nr:citryl-CoA lyase [Bacillus pumilus]AVM22636.1 citryl-CoA lyase [Bacillus pumilus]TYS45116.1 citryl-CoA lyase [Bacillus pumilus]